MSSRYPFWISIWCPGQGRRFYRATGDGIGNGGDGHIGRFSPGHKDSNSENVSYLSQPYIHILTGDGLYQKGSTSEDVLGLIWSSSQNLVDDLNNQIGR